MRLLTRRVCFTPGIEAGIAARVAADRPNGHRSGTMTWRVLHMDAGKEWRGGQRQVLLLARGLRDHGHEPLVVATPESPLLRRLHAQGLATSAVRMRADWDLAAVRRIRALLRTWRPDLVHAHDARAHAIAMAALAGRFRDIPLIVSRRVAFIPKGRVKYGARVTRFIAISDAVRRALMAGGVDASRIDVVYSGVPLPRALEPRDWRVECHWPAGSIVCGVVGAMTAEKGLGMLEHVGAALPQAVRDRARLVLLGGRAGGGDRVGGIQAFRAGFVDDIHPAMAGLDVLWHPSSAEGLGTAVIDALALGVPPVGFATGGLPELVRNEVDGLLVKPGDAEAFAAAAARLITDDALRARIASTGPARAAEFSAERMVKGTESVYTRVLERG